MSDYATYRSFGSSHEEAVLLHSRSIVEDELRHPRDAFDERELHTVLANARQDVSAITILLVSIARRQRRIERWTIVGLVILFVIALRWSR
jgi:hypothetical protein